MTGQGTPKNQFLNEIRSDLSKLKPPIDEQTFLSAWIYVVALQFASSIALLLGDHQNILQTADSSSLLALLAGSVLIYAVFFWLIKNAVIIRQTWARWVLLAVLGLQFISAIISLKSNADASLIASCASAPTIPLLGLMIYWLIERPPLQWLKGESAANTSLFSRYLAALTSRTVSSTVVLFMAMTAGLISLRGGQIPRCGSAEVTETLKGIIAKQVARQPAYSWMSGLMKLPDNGYEGEPFNISLTSIREEEFKAKKRYCSIDLELDINENWVDGRLARLQKEISGQSEMDQKIVLGQVQIARTVSKAQGNHLAASLKYSVQKTEDNDVYVQIER